MSPTAPRRVGLLLCAVLVVTSGQWARAQNGEDAGRAVGIDRTAQADGMPERRSTPFGPAGSRVAPVATPRELSLREAFLIALQQNKDIDVAVLGADASEARIDSARGEFDARIFVEADRRHNEFPVDGIPIDRSENAQSTVAGGIRQRIVTGTDLELSASNNYTRVVEGDALINPRYVPNVSVSQRQDILKNFGIDINRTNITVAQNNHRISEEEIRNQIINSLVEVELAYWELYFSIQDLGVRRSQYDRAMRLVERAEAFEEEGEGPELDVTRAKSNAALQSVSILRAENRVRRLRHQLLRAMGIIDVHEVAVEFGLADAPAEPDFHTTLAQALQVALGIRPDYVQAELAVANSSLQQRFAKNQRLPTLQAVAEYSVTGLDDDFRGGATQIGGADFDSWKVGVLFEWPFPNRTARGDYRAAYLEYVRAKVRRDAVLERITRQLADALDDLRTSEERIASARESRGLAALLLKAEEKSFDLGLNTSLDLLDAQEDLAQAERDVVRARADYAMALSGLLRSQGNFLEAKAIPFVPRSAR